MKNAQENKPDGVFDAGAMKSERVRSGKAKIRYMSPNYHYHLINYNDPNEMQRFADLGYEPARGKETFEATAFDEILGKGKEEIGGLKIRGNRILVRCPIEVYNARQKKMIGARHKSPEKTSGAEARKTMAENTGAGVQAIGETEDL